MSLKRTPSAKGHHALMSITTLHYSSVQQIADLPPVLPAMHMPTRAQQMPRATRGSSFMSIASAHIVTRGQACRSINRFVVLQRGRVQG